MAEVDLLALIMRWAHILSAVTAAGGACFIRFILMPAVGASLDDEASERLRESFLKRWRPVLHTCILLFLISGFYNYLVITRFQHPEQPAYHAIFGIKFLLALAVFVIAIALASRGGWAAFARARRNFWSGILVLLVVVVILLSGLLRAIPDGAAAAAEERSGQAVAQETLD